VIRIGGHDRSPIRRQLRESGEHDARDSRVIERMRLIAHQREANERGISCLRQELERAGGQVDRQVGEPQLALCVEAGLEPDDVDDARRAVGPVCRCFLERDVPVRRDGIGKVLDARRQRQIRGLPDGVHPPLREVRLELLARYVVERAVRAVPERDAKKLTDAGGVPTAFQAA